MSGHLKNSGPFFQNWEMNPGLRELNSSPHFSVTRSHKPHTCNVPEEGSQIAGIVNTHHHTHGFTIPFKNKIMRLYRQDYILFISNSRDIS